MDLIKLTLLLSLTLPLSAGAAASTIHKDFKTDGITLLAVESINGNIAITPGAAGAISADITFDAEKCAVTAETRGKTVYLEAKYIKKWRLFSFASRKESCAKFDIKAPADLAVNPVSVSGNLTVEQHSGPVSGKTVSGDVAVTGAGPLSLTTVSGDLKLSDAAGTMRLKTTSGDITGSIKASEDIEAGTVSGDIDLDILKTPEKGAFALKTVSGDLTLTFPRGAKANTTFHSVSGGQKNKIINDPASPLKINAQTTSGNLTISAK